MKKLLLILPFVLMGCTTLPSKIEIQEVKVPVIMVPAPPVTEKPKLESAGMTIKKDGYDGFVKALESDLIRIRSYTDSLENVINTYLELSKENKNGIVP